MRKCKPTGTVNTKSGLIFTIAMIVLLAILSAVATPGRAAVFITHSAAQSVDNNGVGNCPELFTNPPQKVTLRGIIISRPDFMSDTHPDATATPPGPGRWWQMFIQSCDPNDHGGTAIWMGQCYDNIYGNGTYTNQQWLTELYRIMHDPDTGYAFTVGDKVQVTGFLKFFAGKTNINERHNTDPAYDFEIRLIEPAAGRPQPELVSLNQLKDANNNFIFDAARRFGCEYYQGRLIRINHVRFTNPSRWGPDTNMEITDGHKTFPVKLGLGHGFSTACNLASTFDIIGILDQEDHSYPYTGSYRIWVTNYDGNGRVLTDRGFDAENVYGDFNHDGIVNLLDFALLAQNWLSCVPATGACR